MIGATDMTISDDDAHFSLGNIPFGIASRTRAQASSHKQRQGCTGKFTFCQSSFFQGLLPGLDNQSVVALQQPILNQFAALGRAAHRRVRTALQSLFSSDQADSRLAACRAPIKDVTIHLPVHVGDFSDFSCSLHHVLNAGEAVLGVRSVPPGFMHFPIGYGGRSSSVVLSGTSIRRPLGQYRGPKGVTFGASKAVDFELEVACVIGAPSQMGTPVPVEEAEEHIFGLLLLNDWSARDIQGLEMNPLGPFNGKSFGTSISPWIVTLDALEACKQPLACREPVVAEYLASEGDKAHYAMSLLVEVISGSTRTTVCSSRLESLYWTFKDMVAHHTINGCGLRPGDLLATGTISGEAKGTQGCLLEITRGGKVPLELNGGGERRYLEDGDGVRITGWMGEPGSETCVGFGSCVGSILHANQWKAR